MAEYVSTHLVEITKTGPLEKLVWAPIKDPDNEIKTIHNRIENPHSSGCRTGRQIHCGCMPGERHQRTNLPSLEASVRDAATGPSQEAQGT